MANQRSPKQIEATLVATTLEYLRLQGLDADEIKQLFAPDVIDGWFAIKERSAAHARALKQDSSP